MDGAFLCVFRSAVDPWQLKPRSDGDVQSQHLLTADQLSRLAGNGGTGDQQMSGPHYDMGQANSGETRDGPKLEDFLGGASLGGQYSDRDSQQPHLESLYYNAGHAASNFTRENQSRINVNLPYSQSGGSLRDVPPSFHVAYGAVTDQSSLSSHHAYDHPHARAQAELQESNLLAGAHPLHAQNLLQAALDQSRTAEMLSDCSLQLPQGSQGTNGISNGFGNPSGLKTWLQQCQHAEKAGGLTARSGLNALANLQPLSLSMSAGSHQSSVTPPAHGIGQMVNAESPPAPEPRKRGAGRSGSKEPSPRKSIDTFGQRTSVYRGVTRHRWTGRYEAHLWDNSCRKEGQTRKGRQVYLGGYDKEEKAAKAYDLAALKYWGASTTINFPLSAYETELEEMKNMSRQEYVASLRRKSSGFSRGASVYRGVTRHHQHGRWQARIGRVAGNKDLYLGTYSTQEEAAEAYDIAAIKFRGINAVTNFDISRYDAQRIQAAAVNGHHNSQDSLKQIKEVELSVTPTVDAGTHRQSDDENQTSSLHTGTPGSQLTTEGLSGHGGLSKNLHEWQMLYQQQAQQQQQRAWGSAAGQDSGQHEAAARGHLTFGDPMRAPSGQTKFLQAGSTATNGMLLRNLMGLEALPADGAAGDSSCSANQGLMGHGLPSSGSMMSTSGYRGNERAMSTAGYQGSDRPISSPQYQSSDRGISNSGYQGSDRGGVVESPKNSVGESEEASSKSTAYESVLQGDLSRNILYLSPTPLAVKMNSYDNNPLSSWIGGSTVQSLSGRPNLSVGGHMGSGPIFAHAWNE